MTSLRYLVLGSILLSYIALDCSSKPIGEGEAQDVLPDYMLNSVEIKDLSKIQRSVRQSSSDHQDKEDKNLRDKKSLLSSVVRVEENVLKEVPELASEGNSKQQQSPAEGANVEPDSKKTPPSDAVIDASLIDDVNKLNSKREAPEAAGKPNEIADGDHESVAAVIHNSEQEVDQDSLDNGPEKLPDIIIPEEPLLGSDLGEDSYVEPNGKGNDIKDPTPPPDESKRHPFALFTIANTDIGVEFAKLSYREKYQWLDQTAPCHSFDLKIPDELAEKSMIKLCIFRPNLEFPDETNLFLLNSNKEEKTSPQRVMGHVINSPDSYVYGRVENDRFYGEVSITDQERKIPTIFVVENINLLNRLMRYNPKPLKHMLMVMQAQDSIYRDEKRNDKQEDRIVYNAVVTKGASLINFMVYTTTLDVNRNPFLLFSTSHNSYICSGEPTMQVDVDGQVRLESGNNKIQVENDGSIKFNIPDKEYTFRPNGRTIVRQGMKVRTLQEHEGAVAITAYSSSSTYDCVLPTPAFQTTRKGGYVCKVCLAMDDTFKQYYIGKVVPKNDSNFAQNYLGHIIDRVSWIFRSMDLDGDTNPENIGLDYDSHPNRWVFPDLGGEDVNEQDIEVLFQSLESYNFADCCLGIGFTMKNFPKDVLGKRTQAKSGPSGVCAGRTGRMANNLIVISANNKKGGYSAITEQQLIYATANQIAGAFGANPDGQGDDLCDQFLDEFQNLRHYLMWPEVMRNTTLAEQSLSPCSKNDIKKILNTCRSSCFDIDQHPFCGNGIVEEGEECDCGSEEQCKLQTCCDSRIGQHPCRKSGIGCTTAGGAATSIATATNGLISILALTLGRHLLS